MATKKNSKVVRLKIHALTPQEITKVKSIMAQVSIRKAAEAAGSTEDLYHNVMSGKSKNMTEFNKIIVSAKKMIAKRERVAV